MPTAEKTTREQVEELYDKGVTEAKDIAEKIDKTPATVYVHLRNIAKERGEKPRKRGRPPKVQTEGESTTKPTPRKAPPRAGKGKAEKAAPASDASSNGHSADEFPQVKTAIEAELSSHRRAVAKLERMLAAFES